LQKLLFFCIFCHFFAKISKNEQKCTLFRPKFDHLQNQGKNGGRKVKGENQKSFIEFLIFQGIRTLGYQDVEYQVIWKSGNARGSWLADGR